MPFMPKEIECKMCPFECKKGKHMIVGDEHDERVSVIINSVTEKIYRVPPKPEGQPIVNKAFERVFELPLLKQDGESKRIPRTIYVTGICEVSGYSVGLMASHKK